MGDSEQQWSPLSAWTGQEGPVSRVSASAAAVRTDDLFFYFLFFLYSNFFYYVKSSLVFDTVFSDSSLGL